MSQKFFWVAILDDDSVIMEFNPDGTENAYRDLPRQKIKFFGLQGPETNYILDLKTGQILIQRGQITQAIDVKVPASKGLVKLTGPLDNNRRYDFAQWKQAYADFNLGGKSVSGNVIEKHIIGWKKMQMFPKVGPCVIELNINIKPLEAPSTPEVQVIIRHAQGGNPILGSPFKINL